MVTTELQTICSSSPLGMKMFWLCVQAGAQHCHWGCHQSAPGQAVPEQPISSSHVLAYTRAAMDNLAHMPNIAEASQWWNCWFLLEGKGWLEMPQALGHFKPAFAFKQEPAVSPLGCLQVPDKREVAMTYRGWKLQANISCLAEQVDLSANCLLKELGADSGDLPPIFCEGDLVSGRPSVQQGRVPG